MTGSTPTKLAYFVQTAPDPLEIDKAGSLTIVGTNETKQLVTLSQIRITIPIGTGATQLTSKNDGTQVDAPDGWSVHQDGGTIDLVAQDGGATVGNNSVLLKISGFEVNPEPGQVSIDIQEAYVEKDQGNGAQQVDVHKIPPELAIDHFNVSPLSFEPGQEVSLSWSGPEGATIQIIYGDQCINSVKGQPNTPLPKKGTYQLEGLQSTTAFSLVVSMQGFDVPAIYQAIATVSRAKITTFRAVPSRPVLNEPVCISFEVEADSIKLDPAPDPALNVPLSSSNGQPIIGSYTFVPTQESVRITLDATSGTSADQQQVTVEVRRPEITLAFDAETAQVGTAQTYHWSLSNTPQNVQFDVEVRGAMTQTIYHAEQPTGPYCEVLSGNWTGPADFPTSPDLAIGEDTILTATTPWLPGADPIVAARTLPYTGPQNLSFEAIVGGVTPAQLPQYYGLRYWFGSSPTSVRDRKKIQSAVRTTFSCFAIGQFATSLSVKCCVLGTDTDWQKLWGIQIPTSNTWSIMGEDEWELNLQDASSTRNISFLYLTCSQNSDFEAVAKSALQFTLTAGGHKYVWSGLNYPGVTRVPD